MPKRFVIRRRVEFCETDAAGMVHFSALFCYMEQVEHAFLRSLQTSVMLPLEDGAWLSWPRVHAECDYIGTVGFEQELDVHLIIQRLGNTSCSYRFDFLSEAGKLIAKGGLVTVCCRVCPHGPSVAPIPIPEELRSRMKPFLCDS